ncbi:hypothetical protein [Paenibacillus qinlingensis]|uniref:Uncharacterized protein n=1 Tax=Paenibacillus qinlingensis TaxID=1837343 RepID=A0ABU1P3P6_9BACL|nr:hypothetical protein [Paenibacillus qinlingensis]MDR6554179.1 hypothetical protein [Paenibacillus qinlingensis]
MINAYPSVMAVNRYQTHKDYYRVGAVSGVAGGKTTTIRRMLDLPFEQLAYKQFAKTAAKDVANFVQTADNVKRSAQSLVHSTLAPTMNTHELSEASSANIADNIQTFIHTYNDLQDQLGDSPDYVSHALLLGLEGAAGSTTLHDLGISKNTEGKLVLQADVLEEQRKQPIGMDRQNLLTLNKFASSLVSNIDRLLQQPAVSLFQLSDSPLQPYGQYQSQLRTYLPVPIRGLLLDTKM